MNDKLKVVKFGGTSMATAEQIKKACDIVLSDSNRKIMVVSAPGKRFKDDEKVTDLLIELANKMLDKANVENVKCAGAVEDTENAEKDRSAESTENVRNEASAEEALLRVLERYNEIADQLELGEGIKHEIEKDLRDRMSLDRTNKEKYLDCLKAAGEDNSAKLTANYLQKINVDAKYFNPKDAGLFLDDAFGNARMLPESYEGLSDLKNEKSIVVFPGFFGYSKAGDVVTFSRGGSDITGAILAAAVDADVYENFTDVDYVFAAHPGVVKNPEPIPSITYQEMRELSYAGFTVLHEETLEPAYRKGIPINIRNTNNPDAPGTMITKDRKQDGKRPVVGIAGEDGFISIYVSKYMMNREVGFGRKLLQILEEEGVSYDHTPSGIDNISIVIREKNISGKKGRIIERIRKELKVDSISVEGDNSMVMLVGEGMAYMIGIAARAASALAKAGVNIEMINQGSSEISVMFGVKSDREETAIRVLYDEFFA